MKTAMILAAGRGERLKPVTNNLPKALCKVRGVPLIEHHVRNLAACGFSRLVINHAWFGDQIRRHLGNGSKWGVEITYSPEPPGGLETGGGIFNALPLLGSEPFLSVNADIYTDFDFSCLSLASKVLAHLVLVNNPGHNRKGDFGLLDSNHLTNSLKSHTYAGIACYHPELFRHARAGRYSIIPLVRELANQQLASAEIFDGFWADIGSVDRLKEINSL